MPSKKVKKKLKTKKWKVTLTEFSTCVRTFTYFVTDTDSNSAIESAWEKKWQHKNWCDLGYPKEVWDTYDTDSKAKVITK
jgi:hypothetical protein